MSLIHPSLKERFLSQQVSSLMASLWMAPTTPPLSTHYTLVLFRQIAYLIHEHMTSVLDPSTGKTITKVSEGTPKDVDLAVQAAQRAFDTTWGLNCPGTQRSFLLNKLADLMAAHADVYAALEAMDAGKAYAFARGFDVEASIGVIRYYAGWADKLQGDTIETSEAAFCYTRREPYGVVGQIVPWNFPRKYIPDSR